MQHRPDGILTHARGGGIFHRLHRLLTGMDAAPHGKDIILPLDRAGVFHHLFTILNPEAEISQRVVAMQHDLVDGEAAIVAGPFSQQITDLGGKPARGITAPVTRGEIEH